MLPHAPRFIEFGPFCFDLETRLLRRAGEPVALSPKAADLLAVLVASPGTLQTKAHLLSRVWPDTFVEEGNLPVTIFALRKALGDDGETFIKTIPKRGYCFVADVQPIHAPPAVPAPTAAAAGMLPQAYPDMREAVPSRTPWYRPWPKATLVGVWAVAMLAVAGLAVNQSRTAPTPSDSAVISLAVLPFATVDVSPADEFLGAGLAADVIGRLTTVPSLIVRPLWSALKYGGPQQDPIDAGRQLRADAVMTGQVRATGGTLQVSAQVVRVSDGRRLWSLPSVDATAGLLQVGGLVADGVAAVMAGRPGADHSNLRLARTSSIAAYRDFLQGLALGSQLTAREVLSAAVYFERATAADPRFADANAARVARARVAATQALATDDGLGAVHAALAATMVLGDGKWDAAEAAFTRAIALEPNGAEIRLWHAIAAGAQARHDTALAEIDRALEVDPTSPRIHLYRGMLLFMARRYDEAIAQFRQTPLDIGVVNQQVYFGIGIANAKRTRYDQAQAAIERVLTRTDNPQAQAHLAFVLAESGARDHAARLLDALDAAGDGPRAPHVLIGAANACLGRMDAAFERLGKARREGDTRALFLKVDPALDCARSDPRFLALVERSGLAP